MATTSWTSWVNITSTNFTNGGTTSLRFKYVATRDSGSSTTVKLKLEPQVKHTNSSSNGCFVFFNESSFKTSTTPSTYTHKCACNKTYGGSTGPYYGATGTTTASTTDDYPVDSDAWVVGAWDNITITNVSAAATSLTLYFYFTNYYGFGNYVDKVDPSYQVWKNSYYGAKQNRLSFTFTIPVGYTNINDPGKPQINHVSGTAPLIGPAPYWIDQSLKLTWDAPDTSGVINNGVKSYDLYVDRLTNNGWTGYKLLKTGVTSGCIVTRSDMVAKFGEPNTNHTSGATSWWDRFDFKIYANPKNGSAVKTSDSSYSCAWNEAPSGPTEVYMMVNGIEETASIPKIAADQRDNTLVYCGNATDRYLPTNLDYNATNSPGQIPAGYTVTFGSGSTAETNKSSGQLISNTFTCKIPVVYGANYAPGAGAHTYKVYAWDGQLNSVEVNKKYYVGQTTILEGGNEAIQLLHDGSLTNLITQDISIKVPSLYVDKEDNNCRFWNTTISYTLQASIKVGDNWADWIKIDSITQTSVGALDAGIIFDDVYNKLVEYFNLGFNEVVFRFRVIITPSQRPDMELVQLVYGTEGVTSFKKPGIKYDSNPYVMSPTSDLQYPYRHYRPVLRAQNSISVGGPIYGPAGVVCLYSIQYSEFNTALVDSKDSWTTCISRRLVFDSKGETSWADTIPLTLLSLSYDKVYKLRVVLQIDGATETHLLFWPSLDSALTENQQRECYAVGLFEQQPSSFLTNSFSDGTLTNEFNTFSSMPNDSGEYKQEDLFGYKLNYIVDSNPRAFALQKVYYRDSLDRTIEKELTDAHILFYEGGDYSIPYSMKFKTERSEDKNEFNVYGQFTNIDIKSDSIPIAFNETNLSNSVTPLPFLCNNWYDCAISFEYAEVFSSQPGWTSESLSNGDTIYYNTSVTTNGVPLTFYATAAVNTDNFSITGISRSTQQEGGE